MARGADSAAPATIAPVSDDWRIRIDVDESAVPSLLKAIERTEPDDLAGGTNARFPVSHADEHVFIYADAEPQARRLIERLGPALAESGLSAEAVSLWRWHPIEERWEEGTVPLPETELEREREHARRQGLEARRSRESGLAEWEIRITLPSRDAARELAEQLEREGLATTRGWRHVIVGAVNEDAARELAARLRGEAPQGSHLHVEPGGGDAWRITHPFAVFGGLGG